MQQRDATLQKALQQIESLQATQTAALITAPASNRKVLASSTDDVPLKKATAEPTSESREPVLVSTDGLLLGPKIKSSAQPSRVQTS